MTERGAAQRATSVPLYVIYRKRARRVYAVLPARHGGHRHFVLRYRSDRVPPLAATMSFGPCGRAGVIAVVVRSDHVRPVPPTGPVDLLEGQPEP